MNSTNEYLKRTAEYNVAPTKIFTFPCKPLWATSQRHNSYKWARNTNTKTFSSHSCTSSGSSKAENMGADLEDILKMGSSSQKSALTRFFSKELEYMDKNNGC